MIAVPGPPLVAAGHNPTLRGFAPCVQVSTTVLPWWERDDPYWDTHLWHSAPYFWWKYQVVRERDEETGHSRPIRVPAFATPTARPGEWKRMHANIRMHHTAAVLNGFHTMTTKQLLAWARINPSHSSYYFKRAFEFGVLRRGRFRDDGTQTAKKTGLYGSVRSSV